MGWSKLKRILEAPRTSRAASYGSGFEEEAGPDFFIPVHPIPRTAASSSLQAVLRGTRDLLANFHENDYRLGEHRFRILNRGAVIANSPDAVRQVLASPGDNYERKSPQMRQALEPLLGDGLFISHGDVWRERRPFVADLVHKTRLPAFAPHISDAAEETVRYWTETLAGQIADMSVEMSVLAAEVIARGVFGVRLGRELALEVIAGFADYQAHADSFNVGYFMGFNDGLPIRRSGRLKRAIGRVHAVVGRALAGDLPSSMKCSHAPAGAERSADGHDAEFLRREAPTLFMAGYETTANTLAWAWYLLAHAPWAEAAIQEELARVCAGRTPTLEDIPQLAYCRAVIEETLRLYPPVAYLVRQARRAGAIGSAEVRPAEIVMVLPWLLHRSPDLWDRPNHFIPERFLAEERPAAYAYVPFAAGPRICPGMTLGLTEAVLCLAILSQKFSLRMAPGFRVEPQCRLTLRPRRGMQMTVTLRAGAPA